MKRASNLHDLCIHIKPYVDSEAQNDILAVWTAGMYQSIFNKQSLSYPREDRYTWSEC